MPLWIWPGGTAPKTARQHVLPEALGQPGIGVLGDDDSHHTVADVVTAGDQVLTF